MAWDLSSITLIKSSPLWINDCDYVHFINLWNFLIANQLQFKMAHELNFQPFISNEFNFLEEIQMIKEQQQTEWSQQTSASTLRNVNTNPRQVVKRPIRSSMCGITRKGRGVIFLARGPRRTNN